MFGIGKSSLDRGLEAFARNDWKRARHLLEDAAHDRATPGGDYHLGLIYWRGLGGARDENAAAALFERAAREGHVAAQTAFGVALRAGVGVRQDIEEARKLFRSAAGGDDVEAMLQLAGMGDRDETSYWLERASEMGHPAAMRALSDLLVNERPMEALGWLYASGALTGDEAARKRAAALAREMDAAEIDAAQKFGRGIVKRLRQNQRR